MSCVQKIWGVAFKSHNELALIKQTCSVKVCLYVPSPHSLPSKFEGRNIKTLTVMVHRLLAHCYVTKMTSSQHSSVNKFQQMTAA